MMPRYANWLIASAFLVLAVGCNKKPSDSAKPGPDNQVTEAKADSKEPDADVEVRRFKRAKTQGLWYKVYTNAKAGNQKQANADYLKAMTELDEEGIDGSASGESVIFTDLFDTKDKKVFHEAVGRSCMFYAATAGDLLSIHKLLKAKVTADSTFFINMTPLHMAANEGDVEMASLLLRHGANVNRKGVADMTPLLQAATNGESPRMVELLLEHGADPKARVSFGDLGSSTVLQAAKDSENNEIIRLIEGALAKKASR